MVTRVAGLLFAYCLILPHVVAQNTSYVSGGIAGPANAVSGIPRVSADGHFIAFYSDATNLVAGDTNSCSDVFVRNRLTGITTRASVTSSGIQANSTSYEPVISGDGRYVAFSSGATNLFSGSTGFYSVIVRDTVAGTTVSASLSTSGQPATNHC